MANNGSINNFWTTLCTGLRTQPRMVFKIPYSQPVIPAALLRHHDVARFDTSDTLTVTIEIAMRYAHVPVKQAVISASALSSDVSATGNRKTTRDSNLSTTC